MELSNLTDHNATTQTFTYEGLPPETVDALREVERRINIQWDSIYERYLSIGKLLMDVRSTLKKKKVWSAWVESQLPFSADTAETMMNTAARLQYVPQDIARFLSAKVLRLLANGKVDDEGRDETLDYVAEQQRIISEQEAFVLANGSPEIREQFKAGRLALEPTHRLVSSLKQDQRRASDLYNLCMTTGLISLEIYEYLSEQYQRYTQTFDEVERKRLAWHEIHQSGGYLDIGTDQVYIGDATIVDLHRYKKRRQLDHYQDDVNTTYQTVVAQVRPKYMKDKTWTMTFESGMELPTEADGQLVEITIRVKRVEPMQVKGSVRKVKKSGVVS